MTATAEQCGTSLRSTATTLVPNLMRAALIPIDFVFGILSQQQAGHVTASELGRETFLTKRPSSLDIGITWNQGEAPMEKSIVDTIKEAVFGLTGEAGTEPTKNAVDLLKEDHRKVEALFKSFEESSGKRERGKLLEQIVSELSAHATAEEKLVYPLLAEEGDKAKEAYEEHHAVKLLLAELAEYDGSEENVKAKVKVLSEIVKHHVKEEEGDLLPRLKDANVDLDELGGKIENEKNRLKSSARTASKTGNGARAVASKSGSASKSGRAKSPTAKPAASRSKKSSRTKSAAAKSSRTKSAAAKSSSTKSRSTSRATRGQSAARKSSSSARRKAK